MKILHVLITRKSLPPLKYGGTQRVVWSLSKAQEAMGHEIRFLWGAAKVLPPNASVYRKDRPMDAQIGDRPDVVHFHYPFGEELHKPFLCTEHFNSPVKRSYPLNTVFVSKKHAKNFGAECFVHNGLDWARYGQPNLTDPGEYFHFIGKIRLPFKNLDGAIRISKAADVRLRVLGGHRLDVSRKYGLRFETARHIRFCGTVSGAKKHALIRNSSGLIAPVRWHEPFGLVFIESLYLGTPVFSTPYGALPEIVQSPEIGVLSADSEVLIDGVRRVADFDRRRCHELAKTQFGAERMAKDYQRCYERVVSGETLNTRAPYTNGELLELLPFD